MLELLGARGADADTPAQHDVEQVGGVSLTGWVPVTLCTFADVFMLFLGKNA